MNNIGQYNFKGQKALITGATGHLGREIVKKLLSIGVYLYLTDKPGSNYKFLKKKDLKSVEIIECDLSSEIERNKLIKKINKLDLLINNAAYVGDTKGKGWNTNFKNQSLKTWREAIEINLTAPFHLIRDLSSVMKRSKSASIINISSIYGVIAPDYTIYTGTKINNPAAYAVSKAGLNHFTKWLSATLAPDIRVNSISIGGIERKQDKIFKKKYIAKTLLKKMANEKDIIGTIIFLSSDSSKYITGHNLVVDGGFTI